MFVGCVITYAISRYHVHKSIKFYADRHKTRELDCHVSLCRRNLGLIPWFWRS